MTEQDFIGTLLAEQEWRFQELEFCKKIPCVYTNVLFKRQEAKFWRLCVPIIYAHWEGFVVAALRILTEYINEQNIYYREAVPSILLLENKKRFGYLQGNCSIPQQTRFLLELLEAQDRCIILQQSNITANSNLSFKQLSKMLKYFGINASDQLLAERSHIEKLLKFRNSIAHGENSITVTKEHVESFIYNNMVCIDEIISLLHQYVTYKQFYSTGE